ncbi:MAG: AtpZ/AtpI family protein [bacterium]|nr:AtpZ/AtpI family protein [bacterium]
MSAPNQDNKYLLLRRVGLLTAIPLLLGTGPIVGFYIGDWLDKRFNTAPWLMLSCLLLGFIAGIKETITLIKMAMKEPKNGN